MNVSNDKILLAYSEAYQKLYQRKPRELRLIENDFVIVNGARMRVSDLEHLAIQLQREYARLHEQRRSIVNRLLTWFKSS